MARPTVTMQLTGLNGLKKAVRLLKKAGVDPDKITSALRPAAEIVRDEAKRIVAYDENRKKGFHLRDSIFVMSKPTSRHRFSVAIAVSYARAPHAHFEEFGTPGHVIKVPGKFSKGAPKRVLSSGEKTYGTALWHPGTPKHPFMRPAWRRKKKAVIQSSGKHLGRLFEGEAKKLNVRLMR